MKSPSEIARIAKHTYYKLRMKIPTLAEPEAMKDDIETLTKVITEEVEQAITTERQRQERLVEAFKEALEFVEQLTHDPYSKDLFKEPPDGLWKEIDEFMKTKGLRVDNLSAFYGRVFRKPIIEHATRILAEAQQVLKEVK